jgi:hypothetical protein
MKVINSLTEIIPHIPTLQQGEYNNSFSFILIGGGSYQTKTFNKVNIKKDDDFYRKFDYEVEFPNINFQKRLSKISTTFSFDRPTDLLNNNLYSNDTNKYIYIATLKDLSIKKNAKFILNLFNYHKIKPPYVFVVFSEGGFDVICFQKYYPKLVKQIFYIDTPILEKSWYEFEEFRGGKNDMNQGLGFYKRLSKKQFSWNYIKYDNLNNITREELEKIDLYNFEIKTYNVIMKLKISDFSKSINMFILWSPYYISPTKKCKEKINILKKFSKKLNKYKNIKTEFIDAPHQMEVVIPKTLSNYIITNTLI